MTTPQPIVLIVEDEPNALEALAELVGDEGFHVYTAANLQSAREAIVEHSPQIVLTDLVLPDGLGSDLLQAEDSDYECVVITGHASLDTAVEALRGGAVDYLTKPLDIQRLRSILSSLKRQLTLHGEIRQLRDDLRHLGRFAGLVGRSPAMQEVYDTVARVAATDVSVLIVGESGTGKDLVAETIHAQSRRKQQPFIPVNCGALPSNLIESELFGHERGSFTGADREHRGFFERASGGTLFLDEIGSTPAEFQVKLLRVLETSRLRRIGGESTQEVDVRVIAATNREPVAQIESGELREDLYYRLKVFSLTLPPLRDRPEDIPLLAEHFLQKLDREHGTKKDITDAARRALVEHAWPGNVRELKNVLAHGYVLAENEVDATHLPPELTEANPRLAAPGSPRTDTLEIPANSTIAEAEKALIQNTMERCDGNKERAAASLGVSLKTLYNRLKLYRQEDR